METYIVQFLEDETLGVHGISVVDDPANEFEIVTLKKQSVELRAVDREKRLFFSAVLIPNQKIPRVSDTGEPYNIMFPEETIRMAQQNYIKRGYATNSTLEHNENDVLNGITFVEHWIKEDAIHDKSVKFSKEDLPLGTWCTIFRVDNEEILNKIESGEINGISIDGEFKFEKVNLKSEINMNAQEIVKEALAQLGLSKGKVIKLGKIPFEADAEMAVYFEGDELVTGTALFLDEEMTQPAPNGEHVLAGGLTIVVADGIVSEIKDAVEMSEEAVEEISNEEETLIEEIATLINEDTPDTVTEDDSLAIAESVFEKVLEIVENAESVEQLKAKLKKSKRKVSMKRNSNLDSLVRNYALSSAKEIAQLKEQLKNITTQLSKKNLSVVALGATSPEVVREIKEPKNFKERMFNELQKAK
jgi:hypothetical protein